jgi:hypothetical protein
MIESEDAFQPFLPPVDPNEIAFAMALFVAASEGRIHAKDIGASGFPLCENPFDLEDNPLDTEDSSDGVLETSPESVPLSRAVSVLWHHYTGDERQKTFWCRVVAFHVMMVHSHGTILKQWTIPCTKDKNSAFLDPALVYAVATAELREFGQFRDVPFLEAVGQFTDSALVASVSSFPKSPEAAPVRVFDRLRRSVATFGGRRAFEAPLSRALVGPGSQFPWLHSVNRLTPSELFDRVDQHQPGLGVTEVAEAAAAVVASLVELLHSLLGENATKRPLHNAWADDECVQPEICPSFGKASRNAYQLSNAASYRRGLFRHGENSTFLRSDCRHHRHFRRAAPGVRQLALEQSGRPWTEWPHRAEELGLSFSGGWEPVHQDQCCR